MGFESISIEFVIEFQSCCMSDPPLSDIDFNNKMDLVQTTLKMSGAKI